MKRYLLLPLFLFTFVMLLVGCSGGNVKSVHRVVGDFSGYDLSEIEKAMDIVCDKFEEEFDGCILQKLEYNEAATQKAAEEWARQYADDEAIVLISRYEVGPNGGDGSLQPMQAYENWQWILTRKTGGNWILRTWGYG